MSYLQKSVVLIISWIALFAIGAAFTHRRRWIWWACIAIVAIAQVYLVTGCSSTSKPADSVAVTATYEFHSGVDGSFTATLPSGNVLHVDLAPMGGITASLHDHAVTAYGSTTRFDTAGRTLTLDGATLTTDGYPSLTSTDPIVIQAWEETAGLWTSMNEPEFREILTAMTDPAFTRGYLESVGSGTLHTMDDTSDPYCSDLLKIAYATVTGAGGVSCGLCLTTGGITLTGAGLVIAPAAVVTCLSCFGATGLGGGAILGCMYRGAHTKSKDECNVECSSAFRGAGGAWNGNTRTCDCTCDETRCELLAKTKLAPGEEFCGVVCTGAAPTACNLETHRCGDGKVGCGEICDGTAGCAGEEQCDATCSKCEAKCVVSQGIGLRDLKPDKCASYTQPVTIPCKVQCPSGAIVSTTPHTETRYEPVNVVLKNNITLEKCCPIGWTSAIGHGDNLPNCYPPECGGSAP